MTAGTCGTVSGYNYARCRCEDCKHAVRTYRKRLRAGVQPPALLDGTGTTRRMQALLALGWPIRTLAIRLGYAPSSMPYRLINGRQMHHTLAAKVVALYDDLSMTPGPSRITRIRARRAGYAPPLAWDDGSIDDPNAQPNLTGHLSHPSVDEVAVRRAINGDMPDNLTTAELLAAVRFGNQRLHLDDYTIADRLGLDAKAVRHLRVKKLHLAAVPEGLRACS